MRREKIYNDKYYEPTPEKEGDLLHRPKKVIEIFAKYKFGRILDVGCGDGNFSVLLKEACNAKEVYGIEISKKGVELANKKGVKALQLDVDKDDFPFEDNCFDAIFCGDVIEHLYDPDQLLDEMYRVSKRGGICVITTPNLASWINRISLLFGFQPYATNVSLKHSIGHLYEPKKGNKMGEADHKKVLTYHSLIELLSIHKFTILNGTGACIDLQSNVHLSFFVNTLDKIFSLFPSLAHNMIITVTNNK